MNRLLAPALLLVLLSACSTSSQTPVTSESARIAKAIDDFHNAASVADETRYFALIADDGVFIGTDASERWTKKEFFDYAHPHFSRGRGWTFVPRDRHLGISPRGDVAWFDEMLDSASYGVCRGSGVLRRDGGEWKIVQYNLSIPIPNDLAKSFVEQIRGAKKP